MEARTHFSPVHGLMKRSLSSSEHDSVPCVKCLLRTITIQEVVRSVNRVVPWEDSLQLGPRLTYFEMSSHVWNLWLSPLSDEE
ncbi:hypothetical protein CEXT_17101 [Caerostris extrusa]|uniref:Uncharacterized protein n=1 Tax=Caerostris extrusa TaxID=172846 RepID=A0AAV4S2V9_CAEEX|nr:hypothetical protein CEXT_17101 [Caerostris extrusa]